MTMATLSEIKEYDIRAVFAQKEIEDIMKMNGYKCQKCYDTGTIGFEQNYQLCDCQSS